MNHDIARDDYGNTEIPDPERDALELYEAWLHHHDAPETRIEPRRTPILTRLMRSDIEVWDDDLGQQ